MSITLDCFNEQNMQEIEYLLSQSTRGLHIVFDKNLIKQAFKQPLNGNSDFEKEDRDRVQTLFSNFIEKGSLAEKESFLKALSQEDQEVLIKAYFHIVENTIKRTTKLVH